MLLKILILSITFVQSVWIETEITEQDYDKVYYCPKDKDCHFTCHRTFASCLNVQFHCKGTSTCNIDCTDELACSYVFMNCTDTANCHINCAGDDSCSLMELSPPCGPNANCTTTRPKDITYVFSSSIGVMLTKAFAIHGHIIKNAYVLWEGSIQLLCFDLPKNTTELQELFDNVKITFNDLIVQTNKSSWQNHPDFNFTLIDPLVVGFVVNTDSLLTMTIQNTFDQYRSTIYPSYATVDTTNFTVTIYLTYYLDVPFSGIEPILLSKMSDYMLDALSYPNSSFIDMQITDVNSTFKIMNIYFPRYHCEPPAPFYGTYCWLNHWYSEGQVIISVQDLIASPSGSVHHGSIQIDESVSVVQSTFQTIGIVVNSSSVLQVLNSTVFVSETLTVINSIVEISGNGDSNITANGITLDQASLMINLTPEQEKQLNDHQQLYIPAVNSENINGQFDKLILISSNGSIANYNCLKSSQNIEYSRMVILLELDESCNNHQETPQFLATVIVVPIITVILIVISVVVYFKRKKIEYYLDHIITIEGSE